MLEIVGIVFIIQILFFAFASYFKTDKVTDLSYGLTFVFLALYMLSQNPQQLLVLSLPIAWGIRLSWYLFARIMRTKTDKRFDGVREKFWPFARFWFLQAISIAIISLPFIFYGQNQDLQTHWLGVVIFILGLSIETVADYQKYYFKNQGNTGLITTGLWRFSRHPNYFGEMLVWWGIYLAVFPTLNGWQYASILSPVYITLLLIFGSGVPTLEKNYQQKYGQAWLDYKQKTSCIIPWFPRA